jgi:lysophospholipase L1-like esterase
MIGPFVCYLFQVTYSRACPAFVAVTIAMLVSSACAEKSNPPGSGSGGKGAQGGAGGAPPATGGASATGGSSTGGSGGVTGGSGGVTGGSGGGNGGSSAGVAGTAAGIGGGAGMPANGGTAGSSGGGAATGGGGAAAGGAGGGGGAPPSGDPALHFVGRVDTTDPNAVKFAWSGTGVIARFQGTSVGVRLSTGQEYTVVLDGMVQPKLVPVSGITPIATGLAAGAHTVELYRRTEGAQGVSTFMGFDFGGGTLLAPPSITRRLEFIGDSITCGYGNEGPDMNCPFTPQTENHYLAYPSLTARALNAEVSTVAWSGKGVACNYGDDASSCTNPLPTYYERILPDQATPLWDFSKFVPDAVVVNLGTNDLSTTTDPTQAEFETAYRALLEKIRSKYPNAHILCTNGPMLGGEDLTTVRSYLTNVVTAMADAKISTFTIDAQDGTDGYGCDWHPSLARHEKVAAVVTAALRAKLGW